MAEVKLRALGLREVDFGDYDRYLTAPVSYTHLDVYKRQGRRRSG